MAEYIEREALVTEILGLTIMDSAVAAYADAVLYHIQHMPAKDVAPVVYGKWTQCFEDWQKQITGDECSACGFRHYGTAISHYHYCPNCGANMEEGR